MYSRHTEIPTLDTRPGWQVEARYYNQVALALRRLGPEIRLPLPILKHLDLILQPDAWVVVDRVLNDMPVVAWTAFRAAHRHNLHRPVACELRLYHSMAPMVTNRALNCMADRLTAALAQEDQRIPRGQVVAFRPRSSA
ncbi:MULTISPECIES: hypothetical protein [unclassified Thioalkalivibrio]|uniref:hypothetical protein n=1 Tax=unclassified Thioalkalivibrio TaxID=2621013 RepID=UPI000361F8D2|nr:MULTISPECIES: hypothetical protein [unclassified Thioalkalivibrio]